MIPKDREVLEASGGSNTGEEFRNRTWQRVMRVDRAPLDDKKSGGGGSAKPNGPGGYFGIASKMQAGSVDPAAVTGRKASCRCWRAQGRIEGRVSTETGDGGRAPEHRSAAGLKPAARSKGLTSQRFKCHVLAVHAGRRTS